MKVVKVVQGNKQEMGAQEKEVSHKITIGLEDHFIVDFIEGLEAPVLIRVIRIQGRRVNRRMVKAYKARGQDHGAVDHHPHADFIEAFIVALRGALDPTKTVVTKVEQTQKAIRKMMETNKIAHVLGADLIAAPVASPVPRKIVKEKQDKKRVEIKETKLALKNCRLRI